MLAFCSAMVYSGSKTQKNVRAADGKAPAVVFHKTRMCRFHILGKCTRGAACLFAHSTDALQKQPDFSCTRLCPHLIQAGFCDSAQCKFAHSREELRHRRPTEKEMEVKKNKKESMLQASKLERISSDSSSNSGSSNNGRRKKNIKTDEVLKEPVDCCSSPLPMHGKEQISDDDDDEFETCFNQSSWSRQSTEDLDCGDFNRGVSEESQVSSSAWPSIEDLAAEANEMLMQQESSSELTARLQQYVLPEVPYQVKNTFIEPMSVPDVELPCSRMRRSASVPAMALA